MPMEWNLNKYFVNALRHIFSSIMGNIYKTLKVDSATEEAWKFTIIHYTMRTNP